jgi:hypothetical protein
MRTSSGAKFNLGVHEAMKAAAATRFRPILMTTFAMIFGMLPLSLGLTEGAEERASMGTVLIGGLISSLILTFALVPVMYTYVMDGVEARHKRRAAKAARRQEHDVPDFDPAPRLGAGFAPNKRGVSLARTPEATFAAARGAGGGYAQAVGPIGAERFASCGLDDYRTMLAGNLESAVGGASAALAEAAE